MSVFCMTFGVTMTVVFRCAMIMFCMTSRVAVAATFVFRCAVMEFCMTSRVAVAATFVFRCAVTEFCTTSRVATTAAAAATSPDPHERRCAARGSSISLSQTSPAVERGEQRQRVFFFGVSTGHRNISEGHC